MNIREAERKIELLTNDLTYLVDRRNELFYATQPTSIPLKQDLVSGGSVTNKFDTYVCKANDLDPKIDKINNEIQRLKKWIEKELEIIGNFDELTQYIVKHKEQDKMTWKTLEIALYEEGKGISIATARRLYSKYKKVRLSEQK